MRDTEGREERERERENGAVRDKKNRCVPYSLINIQKWCYTFKLVMNSKLEKTEWEREKEGLKVIKEMSLGVCGILKWG
jgi:hypothetical protein